MDRRAVQRQRRQTRAPAELAANPGRGHARIDPRQRRAAALWAALWTAPLRGTRGIFAIIATLGDHAGVCDAPRELMPVCVAPPRSIVREQPDAWGAAAVFRGVQDHFDRDCVLQRVRRERDDQRLDSRPIESKM